MNVLPNIVRSIRSKKINSWNYFFLGGGVLLLLLLLLCLLIGLFSCRKWKKYINPHNTFKNSIYHISICDFHHKLKIPAIAQYATHNLLAPQFANLQQCIFFLPFFLTEWYFNYNVILLMTMHTIGCNQRILTGDYTKVDPPLLQVLPKVWMLFISSWKSYDEERAIYIHSRKICARRNAYCTCSKICRMSPTYTTVIDWSRHKDTK